MTPISEAAMIRDPLWARFDEHGDPDWKPFCAGVLYIEMSTDSALHYVRQGTILAAWGAVGRRLFDDGQGPWLTWADHRFDRVRGCRVAERPWPWNLGDEVVFLVDGPAGLTMVDVELDDEEQARMYAEVGTSELAQDWRLFAAKVEEWVRDEIGPKALRLTPPFAVGADARQATQRTPWWRPRL